LTKFQTKKLIFFATLISLFIQTCNPKNQTENKKTKSKLRNDSLYSSFDQKLADEKAYKLDSLFMDLFTKGVFNGNILVSEKGHVIYKGSFGYKNLLTKEPLDIETPFQIASVSKQFTAVAIMQLKEKGLLKYTDPVYKHVPNFPFDSSINIFSLLTHSSGIPNYIYCLDKVYDKTKPLTNKMVVDLMGIHKPGINYLPNARFNYNNSNYMYLAYIVEKLSGMDFRTYAKKNLFEPAGMKNTFIYDPYYPEKAKSAAKGFETQTRQSIIDYLDGVVGDKGIYSTVGDLLLWDNALNTNKLLKEETLAEALKPKLTFKNLETKNYGFGWRINMLPDSSWQTFHTGWWHGFQSFYLHDAPTNSAIICLSNHANGYMPNMKKVEAILYPEKAIYFDNTIDDNENEAIKTK
jgi:CubicO group peptidase (beta-lactamase class C family)